MRNLLLLFCIITKTTMIMKTIKFIAVLLLIYSIIGCSKEESAETFSINYHARINVNDTNVINDKITYADIVGYDSLNYTFLIDSAAGIKLRNYFFPSDGLPFSLKINGEVIYTGNFFPSYSETLPYGIYIDPYSLSNKLTVNIAYGFCRTDDQFVDNRNDKRILSILNKDKKIIKINL